MDKLSEATEMVGGYVLSFKIPILKVLEWFKKKEGKKEYEWVYDGCGCMPPEGGRSESYCHEHYNPLIRVEHEI